MLLSLPRAPLSPPHPPPAAVHHLVIVMVHLVMVMVMVMVMVRSRYPLWSTPSYCYGRRSVV